MLITALGVLLLCAACIYCLRQACYGRLLCVPGRIGLGVTSGFGYGLAVCGTVLEAVMLPFTVLALILLAAKVLALLAVPAIVAFKWWQWKAEVEYNVKIWARLCDYQVARYNA
jgi:hypothetical protein